MASTNAGVEILEICHVSPSVSANELSLPLTYFDTFWLKFHPVERLYFYELPQLSFLSFSESIVPKLKSSISSTLFQFLPLAGNLVWPPQSQEPFIQYSPGDSVVLTVAVSDAANFDSLSNDGACEAITSRPLVPQLQISDTKASTIALQITLFPDKGFCIGITCHHAVLDGKSSTMFMKAWAEICKKSQQSESIASLAPELTPSFDRNVIRDPTEISVTYINQWIEAAKHVDPDCNSRSLKLLDKIEYPQSLLRATFRLARNDIKNLRDKVISSLEQNKETLQLSTFVTVGSYVINCLLKATKFEDYKRLVFGFAADFRARLDPQVPTDYVGNCVGIGGIVVIEPPDVVNEDGMIVVVKKMNQALKRLETEGNKRADKWLSDFMALGLDKEIRTIGVAGSARFEVYATDFGWGKPRKVEIVSVDRDGSIAIAENREEHGGVELGLVLKKQELEAFASTFHAGLAHGHF